MSGKVCKILLRPFPPAWDTPSRRGICDVDFLLYTRNCFDRSFIICIFATIYIITERDHEKIIDFLRIFCRARAAQEDFHGIRLQSENLISLILFTAPAPEGDFPPIGERNGGALPYDPLFTLLLCDALRTDLSSARHSAECAGANPRGLCVTKCGQDDAHLLLRCTACHSHRHDMGDWGDAKGERENLPTGEREPTPHGQEHGR